MKQIVIISGKGGTGKTMLTGAFAALAENKVLADCDVDAANLHLLLHPSIKENHPFKSGFSAVIDPKLCTSCGQCAAVCRFDAASPTFIVDPVACEGCSLCARVCPSKAIRMKENTAGEWFISETRYGSFVHAKLGIAEENSGKLVTKVRQTAKELAETQGADFVIVDGPPGIGCPVIASLSGINLAVIVTEPTISGIHDVERVIELTEHFDIRACLVINKWDLNPSISKQIKTFCTSRNVPLVGEISFDRTILESVISKKTAPEHVDAGLRKEFVKIWEAVRSNL